MARATSLKLVMRHFAPSPTNDARRCWAAAAAGLRRARRIAAIRLCASCRFTSLNDTGFTDERDTANWRWKQECRSTVRVFQNRQGAWSLRSLAPVNLSLEWHMAVCDLCQVWRHESQRNACNPIDATGEASEKVYHLHPDRFGFRQFIWHEGAPAFCAHGSSCFRQDAPPSCVAIAPRSS